MRLLLCFTSMLLLAAPVIGQQPQPKIRFLRDPNFTVCGIVCPAPAESDTECSACPACPACHTCAANEDADCESHGMNSCVIRLQHGKADRVAAKVSEALKRNHNLEASTNGLVVSSPVIIVPDATTNSLMLMANSEFIEETKQLIAQSDVEPRRFTIKIKLSASEGENAQRVEIAPMITTVEGTTAHLILNSNDDRSYQFDIDIAEAAQEVAASTGTTQLKCDTLTLTAPCAHPSECSALSIARAARMLLGAPGARDGKACCSQKAEATADADDCGECACEKAACACKSGACEHCAATATKACCEDGACPIAKSTCPCASEASAAAECPKCASCKCSSHTDQSTAATKCGREAFSAHIAAGETSCRCEQASAASCACKEKCACSSSACSECPCSSSACEAIACPACPKKFDTIAMCKAAALLSEDRCPRAKDKAAIVAIYCHQIMMVYPNSKYATAALDMLNEMQADGSLSTSTDDASESCTCDNCECTNCECENCACTDCPAKNTASCECAGATPCCEAAPAVACVRADDEARICSPAPLNAAETPSIEIDFGQGGPLLTLRGRGMMRTEQKADCKESECDDVASDARRIQLAGHRALSTDEHATEAAGNGLVAVVYAVAEIVSGENALLSKDQLIHLIKHDIEPASWDGCGGAGTIAAFDTTLSLVIRQNAETQKEIGKLIGHLDRVARLRMGVAADAEEIPPAAPPAAVELPLSIGITR